jgi:hypothetical protein
MAHTIKRSAEAALLGFHYQLDKTLHAIFVDASDGSRITIEGVEDIDIERFDEYTSIQCKYLEAQTPTPSAVREPIGSMLIEFKKNPTRPWAFRLYAYFGGSTDRKLDFTPNGLKQILTHKTGKPPNQIVHRLYEEIGASDEDLLGFARCFEFSPGLSFESQRNALIKVLQEAFSVGHAEASEFIYCKALSLVFDLATRGSVSERTVTRADVIMRVNDASSAFASPWLIRLVGREKALAFITKALKRLKIFTSTKQKTLVIDFGSETGGNALISLKGFVKELVDHTFSSKKSLYDAVPWTILVDVPLDVLVQLKSYLLDNHIAFNDGYEQVRFTPEFFNQAPVTIRHTGRNGKVNDYLGTVSFRCRIAAVQTAGEHLSDLRLGNVLIAVGSAVWQHKFRSASEISMNIGNDWSRAELLAILKG